MRNKAQLIILPLIASSIIVTIIYLFYYKKINASFPFPSKAIPNSSLLVFQGKLEKSRMKSILSNAVFKSFGNAKKLESFYQKYDSLFLSKDYLRDFSINKDFIFSLQPFGKSDFAILILQQSEDKYDEEGIIKAFQKEKKSTYFIKRIVNSAPIFDICNKEKQIIFSFSMVDGIFIGSINPFVTEEGIKALTRSKNTAFQQLSEANKLLEVFILNYPNLYNQFPEVLDFKTLKSNYGVYRYNESFKRGLEINGILHRIDGSLISIKEQGNIHFENLDLIPNQVSYINIKSIKNIPQYFRNQGDERREELSKDSSKLEYRLSNYADGDYISFNISDTNSTKNNAITITDSISSKIIAVPFKEEKFIEETFIKPAWMDSTYKFSFSIDEGGLKVYQLFENFLPSFLKCSAYQGNVYYMAHIGKTAYLSQTKSNLLTVIKRLLAGNKAFSKIEIKKLNELSIKDCNELSISLSDQLAKSIDVEKSEMLILQYSFNDLGQTTNNIKWVKDQESVVGISLLTSVIIGDEAIDYIQAYPKEKNITNLIIGDINNQIYCISNKGNIEWKKQLDGPPNGVNIPLEIFKDGNIQNLLSSTNSVYLFDKNGNKTGNYPLHLGSKATSPIFENSEKIGTNSSYYVATQNNRIYGFEMNGKPIQGWNPKIVDAPIVLKMKSYLFDNILYFTFLSNRGTFYICNQDGKNICKPIEFKRKFMGEYAYTFSDDIKTGTLITIDSSGQLIRNVIGKGNSSIDLKINQVKNITLLDINGDEKSEFIFSGRDKVMAVDLKGKILFKYQRKGVSNEKVQVLKNQKTVLICYMVKKDDKSFSINFIDLKGNLKTDFSIKNVKYFRCFDIDGDGNDEVICLNKQKLSIYKIGI